MTRVARGWRLAKDSWAVLRADRSLAIFPALSFLFGALAFALLIAPGVVVSVVVDRDWVAAPFVLLAAYAATFLGVYFNVALAGAAALSLDGRDTKLADGLAVARARRGQIARWALVQTTVGLLINAIERGARKSPLGPLGAAIVASILDGAWAVATFFVVPVLAFEGVGPKAALKRSIALIRERWGEGVVGEAAITLAVFLVVLLPIGALAGLSALAVNAGTVLGAIAVAITVLVAMAATVAGSAVSVIFRVALYRFATAGQTTPGFAESDLAGAFAPE